MKYCSLRNWMAGFCFAFLFLAIPPLGPAQQTQDVLEMHIGFEVHFPIPQTPSKEISKFLNENIETKEFQQEMPLKVFLHKLEKNLGKNGKQVRFVIDADAFEKENEAWKKEGFDPPAPVQETIIKFGKHPQRMSVGICLRLALSKVVTNNATYIIRRGQILITTIEQAQTPFLGYNLISGNFKKVPLTKVLDEISEMSGVSILVDPRIGNKVRTRITTRILLINLETALRLLTDMTELQYVPVGNVIYVTNPANGPAFAKEYLRQTKRHAKIVEGSGPNWPEPFQFLEEKTRGTFENRCLLQIVDKLASDAPIIVDRRVNRQAQRPMTVRFINPVTLETALAVLTDMAGLKYVVVGNAFYVTSTENARRLEKEEEQRNSKGKQKAKSGRKGCRRCRLAKNPNTSWNRILRQGHRRIRNITHTASPCHATHGQVPPGN